MNLKWNFFYYKIYSEKNIFHVVSNASRKNLTLKKLTFYNFLSSLGTLFYPKRDKAINLSIRQSWPLLADLRPSVDPARMIPLEERVNENASTCVQQRELATRTWSGTINKLCSQSPTLLHFTDNRRGCVSRSHFIYLSNQKLSKYILFHKFFFRFNVLIWIIKISR